MKDFTSLKKLLLTDPRVKQEYDRLAPQFAIATQIIEVRKLRGLTQAELADKMGTKQAAIARLESGSYNPSLLMLNKIAVALDVPLVLKLG